MSQSPTKLESTVEISSYTEALSKYNETGKPLYLTTFNGNPLVFPDLLVSKELLERCLSSSKWAGFVPTATGTVSWVELSNDFHYKALMEGPQNI